MLSATSESIAVNFDDEFVRMDSNFDNEIDVTEASVIKYLNITLANINSISGIEQFVNLQGLNCYGNNLTTVPVGSLTNLRYISCPGNQITSFADIENLPNLESLAINDNPIASISLSNFHQLNRLDAGETLLTEINLCGTAVKWLWAMDNPNLQSLYLKNNVVSSDLAKTNNQIPPPLHNFEFYNSPLLTYVCYDEGEYDAVLHGLSYYTTGRTLTTSCDNSCSLAVAEPITIKSFSLYPNPTSGIVNIYSNVGPIDKITVSNVLGQTVLTFTYTQTIDISPLPKGTYFVTVENSRMKKTQKIIRE